MKFVGKVDVFGVLSQAQRCAKTAGGCHVGSGSEDGSPWGKLDGLESVAILMGYIMGYIVGILCVCIYLWGILGYNRLNY